MSSEVTKVDARTVATTPDAGVIMANPDGVMAIIAKASEAGRSAEEMDKLLTLFERIADRQASQGFADAMAQFQLACPSIPRTNVADFVSKSGQRVRYTFADLGTIRTTIQPVLNGLGLSFRWDSESSDGRLNCTCTLKHVNGHSETATFLCPVDGTKLMSEAQKVKGALTFAMRVSLMQVLGLTDCESDCDGAQPGDPTDPVIERVSREQAATITEFVQELAMNDASVRRFLNWAHSDRIMDIARIDYDKVIDAGQ